jgi:NodT family efflux transporter outer membrane factor (OMF) lipoprotein
MFKYKIDQILITVALGLMVVSCKVPAIVSRSADERVPESFGAQADSTNMSTIPWKTFFKDQNLVDLIDTALQNNQELNITLQEIEITRNDILMRKGAILPSVRAGGGIGLEKVGLYTSQGAGDASTDITPGVEVPEYLMDYAPAAFANWEVDIWKKLRNAKKAAVTRYLSTIEGKNFIVTNLIAEIANSYYELLALDGQLQVVRQNIGIQKNALEIVKIQKEAAQATELAVQKFQAEVLATQSLEFDILQNIQVTENRINFLLGRYPQPIKRDNSDFLSLLPAAVHTGIPSSLLANRPDIKQAELDLTAAKIDVKVARAEFYPSLEISASIGLQAFNPSYLAKFPESLLFTLVGDMAGPIINRNAIKAEFYSANSRQIQAIYNYERTILNAYLGVANQLSNIKNLEKRYDLRSQQVASMNRSIDISNDLFKSARVDYFEVLMTQRDALESKLELMETKKELLTSVVQIYRELGGGWR